MRVMVVTDQYEPMIGGVTAVTRGLARGLAERGHTVALVAPSPCLRGSRRADGRVSITLRGSLRWPWYDGMRLGCLPAAAAGRMIASFAPDVAHIHSPVTLGVTTRIAARRQRVPVVYTNHYLPANVRGSAPGRPGVLDALFYRYVVGFSNRCSHVTAPTVTALGLLRDHGLRAPSGVVSNGVDLRRYSPGPADGRLRRRYGLAAGRPLVLSVGRLSQEKRLGVLLDAAARTDPAIQVAVAGAGPDEPRLRAHASSLGVTARVRFLGFVPEADLPGLYRLADVFAIASEAELQSLATLEAMATGLPVVAVNAGALGELVRDGENGFLVSPGDAAGMAARLDQLCGDPAGRRAMSAVSARIAAAHDRDRCLTAWESLYRALRSARAGGEP
jgi:glycosyltransferase involved in cell wall biosynthesis